MKKSTFSFLFLYSLLIGLFCFGSSPLLNRLGMDSDIFWAMGKGMREGKILYAELFDHKGFNIFFLNYIAQFLSLYLVEVLFLTLNLIVVYYITNIFVKKEASCVFGALAFSAALMNYFTFEGGNFTETYAVTFQLISIYFILRGFQEKEPEKPMYMLIHGICSGICLGLRANMVVMWIPFGAVIFGKILIEKNFASFFKNAAYLVSGVIISILPGILYAVVNQCFGEMIEGAFSFNFVYAASNKYDLKFLIKFLTDPSVFVIILAVCGLIIAFKYKSLGRMLVAIYAVSLLVSLPAMFMSVRTYGHYYHYFWPFTLPVFILLAKKVNITSWKKAAGIVMFCIAISIVGNMELLIKYMLPEYSTSEEYARIAEECAERIKQEGYDKDTKMLVTGNKIKFYNQSGISPHIKYFTLPSVSYKVFQEGIDMQAQSILSGENTFIVISYKKYREGKKSSIFGVKEIDNKILEYLSNEYTKIYQSVTTHQNNFSLYKIKAAAE